MTAIINGIRFSSGDLVSCYISRDRRKEIVNGVINITSSYKAYICHDNEFFRGSVSPNLYGHSYSWSFDFDSDSTYTDVSNLTLIDTKLVSKESYLSDKLIGFTNMCNVSILFRYKLGIFDDFVSFDISEQKGMIKISNFLPNEIINSKKTKKTIEIKIGRLIRKLSNKISAISSYYIPLLDTDIEKIQNKYVAYQNSDNIEIKFLSGSDIKNGYSSSNYFGDGSLYNTLHKSCMTNKDFLSIYTDNPLSVELATIELDDKVAARCLVWTTTNNKKVFDKIYFAHDWLERSMEEKMQKLGYTNIRGEVFLEVKLENWKFSKYPYLDSFYNFNYENGTLYYYDGSNIKCLRNTNGSI